jgi:hypothetical protein
MKRLVALPLAALAITACSEVNSPARSPADLNLSNDFAAADLGSSYNFEGDFGISASPFAPNRTAVIPSDTYTAGGKGFLGKFTNEQVTMVTNYVGNGYLNFSLYIAGTWDGLAKNKYGTDTWEVAAYCGDVATGTPAGQFITTFSNKGTTKQNFPDAVNGAEHAGMTGAAAVGVLGFANADEVRNTNRSVSDYSAVYNMSWQYPAACATNGQVTWVFDSPSGTLQSAYDEFWGVDNVSVTESALYSPRGF